MPDEGRENQLHEERTRHGSQDPDLAAASGVPPTTTAVMALSSIRRPTKLGSAAADRAVTRVPAIAANTAQMT